jgi:hypothetical protein
MISVAEFKALHYANAAVAAGVRSTENQHSFNGLDMRGSKGKLTYRRDFLLSCLRTPAATFFNQEDLESHQSRVQEMAQSVADSLAVNLDDSEARAS